MDKKRILVPGGAGYIGAHTVAALAAAGVETVFALNPGGHFQDPALRTARGLAWLLDRQDPPVPGG